MTRLNAIPCNVITGFLGVGKTTCILDLLKQKPDTERWAILVNEFGEIGLDGQLLEHTDTPATNVFIREVPGGCMCCTSGVPMQIALNLLLMKARPDRLLIEPTGLGHPQEVLRTLRGEHYAQVLSLQTTLTLVNPAHFSSQKHLHNATFQQQLAVADMLVVNKTDLASDADILAFESYCAENKHMQNKAYLLTEHGHVPLNVLSDQKAHQRDSLPKHTLMSSTRRSVFKSNATSSPQAELQTKELPESGFLIQEHQEDGFLSIGWRVDGKRLFDLAATQSWLVSLKALRIKAMLHCEQGWISINSSKDSESGNSDMALSYSIVNNSEPEESRLEMIFDQNDADISKADWQQCLMPDARK